MADQKRTDAGRLGSSGTDVTSGLTGSATPAGGIDPATSTISATPGTHTGRESAADGATGTLGTTSGRGTGSMGTGSMGTGSGMGMSGTGMGTSGMGDSGSGMTDRARQQAGHLADQARQQAAGLAGKARQAVSSQLDSQKDRAASSLGDISDALRQTGQSFRGSDQDMFAGYMEDAAMYVDRITGYIQNRSVNDLLHEAETLARREPALFIGGAFVIGLLGARFLKASRDDMGGYGSYGGGYDTGASYGMGSSYGSGSTYGTGSSYGTGSGYGTGGSAYGTGGSTYGTGSQGGAQGAGTSEYGSYVPGGVAGDYTRTHASDKGRSGSAADEALGDEAGTSSTIDREGF